MINKLAFPLLKKYYKFFIGISIALALSMGLLFGIVSGTDTTDKSLNKFASDYRYGDAIITTNLLSKDELIELNNISGIRNYNSRLTFYIQGKLESGRYINLRVLTYDYRDYALQYVYKIDESDKYPNIAINNSFIVTNDDVNVKDTIEVNIDGQEKTLCIGKSITTPECVNMVLSEYIYGNNPDLAYVYLPEDYMIDTEYENKYNQLFIFFEEWANQDEVLKQIEDVIGKENVLDKALYNNSLIRKRLDINLEPIRTLAGILPTAFFIIVIAVTFLFLTQIIKQSKKDIGILRTLGYKIKDITKLFSKMVFYSSLVSIILGTIFGIIVMVIIAKLYALVFNIPSITYSINILVYLLSIIVTIVSGQFAVLLSINQISKISPKEAFDPEQKTLSNIDIKINSLFSKFNSRVKYSISSILKNKKRFIFSTICLTASVILVFCSWAFYDSKNEIRNSLFVGRIKFDYQYFYNREINGNDLNELNELSSIKDYERLGYVKTTIKFNDLEENATIKGIEDNTKLVGLYNYESNLDSIGDGLIIEKHIAQKLNATIGDTVTINGKDFLIEGMVNEYVDRYCYVKYNNLNDVGNIDQYSIVLNSNDEKTVVDFANKNDSIEIVSSSNGIKKGIDSEFSIYNIAVYIIIACALVIGFVIVYNTTLTNLYEQKKELSVLRTLGYKVKDISKMWLIQTAIQTFISLLLGLLFGSTLAKYALKAISTSSREYPFTSNPKQYILTIIIVVVYVFFTHVVSMLSIKKWNLVENTKEKDWWKKYC